MVGSRKNYVQTVDNPQRFFLDFNQTMGLYMNPNNHSIKLTMRCNSKKICRIVPKERRRVCQNRRKWPLRRSLSKQNPIFKLRACQAENKKVHLQRRFIVLELKHEENLRNIMPK